MAKPELTPCVHSVHLYFVNAVHENGSFNIRACTAFTPLSGIVNAVHAQRSLMKDERRARTPFTVRQV
eukprot:1297368-Prymnesium_polylepis.1